MSTENEIAKLFLAGAVPADLGERIGQLQEKLKRGLGGRGIGLRWTKPEGFHFTLFFLGPVDVARIPELAASARAVAARHPVRPIEMRGVGAFPDERAARVIWAGVRATRELCALREELVSAMVVLGFAAEAREFRPHVTLGRLRDARSLREYVDLYRRRDFGEFLMRELVLYRSHPAVPYPRYEALERFPLRDNFSIPLSEEFAKYGRYPEDP